MKKSSQFGEIPPLLWPGQSRGQHALPHVGEEAVECWGSVTHNAYVITHYAYIARIGRFVQTTMPHGIQATVDSNQPVPAPFHSASSGQQWL
jgi:hypothetical protein